MIRISPPPPLPLARKRSPCYQAMVSSSHSAAATTAATGNYMATNISETIVGIQFLRIDGFSGTKDFGVGKSIRSSTFRVGGHVWYVECYPCGKDEKSAGWVSLFLRREDDGHGSRVSGYCDFCLLEPLENGFMHLVPCEFKVCTFAYEDRHLLVGTDFIQWEQLEREQLLMDDCFQVRCDVFIDKFLTAPLPDMVTKTMAGSHLLTVEDGYFNIRRAFSYTEPIDSNKFHVGGHNWCIKFYPCGFDDTWADIEEVEDEEMEDDRVIVELCLDDPSDNNEMKVRFELTLLTHCGQIISSIRDYSTFSERSNTYTCNFLTTMDPETSPLLLEGIQIRCDVAVVNEIMATPNPRQGIGGYLQGSRQQVRVRGDVTFDVSGQLFTAHKCVLATRCTAFMAEFFGRAGKQNADATDHVRVDDMEPRVFKALLHFIYNDTLPEVSEEEKVVMAQGMLIAADRYAMERLKLVCGDLLCCYINDARTAVTTLNLADKHGCRRLKEACMKFLMDQFADDAH